MKIFTRELGIASTNTFLFINEEAGKAVVFDAPEGSFDWVSEVLEREELALEALYLTHGHYDHILDAWKFREAGIPVHAHRDDRVLIEQAEVQSSFLWEGLELKPVQVDCWLEAGEHLVVLEEPCEVRHVPGHCPGNVLFYFPNLELAVVGDAIFAGSVGRVDLPGGDWRTLENSIRTQIYTLPDSTELLTGHGPPTLVDREKAANAFVRG